MKKVILMLFMSACFTSCIDNQDDSEDTLDSLPKSICAEQKDTDITQVVSNVSLAEIDKVLLAQENKSDEVIEELPVLKVISHKTKATYYSDKFNGKRTATGEVFKQTKLTAAHNKIPLGTIVKVTNINNGKSVMVIVNDRGGKKLGIDLSKSAMKEIEPNYLKKGHTNVKVEQIPSSINLM